MNVNKINNTKTPSFNLEDPIWCDVFKEVSTYLLTNEIDTLSQTCKFFEKLAIEVILPGRLSNYKCLLGLSKNQLLKLAIKCKDIITQLDWTHRANISLKDLEIIGLHCQKLKTLTLNNYVFDLSEENNKLGKQLQKEIRKYNENYLKNRAPITISKKIPSLLELIMESGLTIKKLNPKEKFKKYQITNNDIFYHKDSQIKFFRTSNYSLLTPIDREGYFYMSNKSVTLDKKNWKNEIEDYEKSILECNMTATLDIIDYELFDQTENMKIILNAERFKKVASLHLPFFVVNEKNIELFNNSPLLLEFIELNRLLYFNKSLQKILNTKICKNLQNLNLSIFDAFDKAVIEIIHQALPKLKCLKLKLNIPDQGENWGEANLIKPSFYEILSENNNILPNLEKLTIIFPAPIDSFKKTSNDSPSEEFENEDLSDISDDFIEGNLSDDLESSSSNLLEENILKLSCARPDLNLVVIKESKFSDEVLFNGNYADFKK